MEDSLNDEFLKFHKQGTFHPNNPDDITYEEKDKEFEYLVFVKDKRDNTLKARQCAGGQKQWVNIDPMDASEPTIALELVMLTATIDAAEVVDVAIVDIPGSFLSASISEDEI